MYLKLQRSGHSTTLIATSNASTILCAFLWTWPPPKNLVENFGVSYSPLISTAIPKTSWKARVGITLPPWYVNIKKYIYQFSFLHWPLSYLPPFLCFGARRNSKKASLVLVGDVPFVFGEDNLFLCWGNLVVNCHPLREERKHYSLIRYRLYLR